MKIYVIIENRESNNTRYEVTVGISDTDEEIRNDAGEVVTHRVDDFRSPYGFYIPMLEQDDYLWDNDTNQRVEVGHMDVTIAGSYYDDDEAVLNILQEIADEYQFDDPVIYNLFPED